MFGPVRLHRDARNYVDEHLLGRFRVSHQMTNDDLRGNWFDLYLPAIVIGNHRHGRERDLRFASQFRFRKIGHPDYVETVAPIQFRFRARGKRRAVHVHVSATIMNYDANRLR